MDLWGFFIKMKNFDILVELFNFVICDVVCIIKYLDGMISYMVNYFRIKEFIVWGKYGDFFICIEFMCCIEDYCFVCIGFCLRIGY